MPNLYKEIYKTIKKYDTIVIARHVGADPDALASEIALRDIIINTFPNKKVYAVGYPASKFKFLGILDKFSEELYNNSLLIVLDTPDLKRIDNVEANKFKYELKPMIWSDMYITANSADGYYDLPENTDCSKWEKPKKDLGLVYWDYYHDDTRTYEKMLDIHAQLSDNVIFAGGSWIWNGISPNYSKTYACTKAALSTCKKYNIKEVLCTAWMDNGAETPVDALLPGLVLFAHLDFHRDYDETILKQEFRNCTGGEFDDFMELDNFDSLFLNTKENKEAQNPSKYLLYQDPMLGIFDYHVKESGVNTKSYYQNIQKCMKECAKKTGKYQLLFSFYEKLAAVLADKADLGMCIKSAYDRSDRAALKDISQNVIPGIICNLTDMKSSREKIWMNDAKPFGYEILDIKIGGVITRLKSTGYRIDNYLNGNVLRLEELEEERLPYFSKGMDKRENLWNRIISGCDLNDTI